MLRLNFALLLYQKPKHFKEEFKATQVLHNFHKRPVVCWFLFFFLILLHIFFEDLNTEYLGNIRHCT